MIIALTGSNDYLIRQTLDALVSQFVEKYGAHGVERVSGENFEPHRIAELLQGASLFSPQRLVVLRDAAGNKALWEKLGDWLERVPSDTTLVLVESTPDKRTKTYKLLQKIGELREFGERSEGELTSWLQQLAASYDGEIDAKTARYLVGQVGIDQWRLSHELQKLVHHSSSVTKEAIDELVEATPQASAFELLDAAMGRQPTVVKRLLGKLAAAEDPYKFFGLLTSQVQALTVVHSAQGKTPDAIAKEAGLHPFVVRKTQSLARSLQQQELQEIIETLALCDVQLKSTGADPWLLLEQCLSKLATRSA